MFRVCRIIIVDPIRDKVQYDRWRLGEPEPNRVQGLFEPIHTANRSRVTRTHHSRLWTSLRRRGRPRHTHTHTYTLFDECLAPGPSGCTPHRSLTGWHRRHSSCQRSPTPTPTYLPQIISLLDRAARAWRRPVCPPSGGGSAGATTRAWLVVRLCSRPCIDEGFSSAAPRI